jgi:hypothetical protein
MIFAVSGSTSIAIFSEPDLNAVCSFLGCDVISGILCHVSQLRPMKRCTCRMRLSKWKVNDHTT